jgi:tRNA-Thr(GGU) m(6)t(6)A37 methyltransferase TsaA
VHSPFKEKFGVPRQPGLIAVASQIELLPPFNLPEAVAELNGFSHIWVTFIFHQAMREQWRPAVRPPRLGGNKKVGVFASRSPFRPNHLGLSVVRLDRVSIEQQKICLHVEGLDVIDGTPVVDIKPYVPYSDRVEKATAGFAEHPPEPVFVVSFSEQAQQQCQQTGSDELGQLIIDVLSFDPRPAYKQAQKNGQYGMLLDDFNVRWEIRDDQIWVLSVIPA